MLVNVVAVLEVTVAVVQVVDVAVVLDRLTAVPFGVGASVLGVNLHLRVLLVAVDVVDVAVVLDRLATVLRQVLVVLRLNVVHAESSCAGD